MENLRGNKRALLGLLLVLVGIVLVVSNFNMFPFGWRPYLFSWQALLILLGLFFLLSREAKTTGLILIFIGGFFIIPRLWDVPGGWDAMFWPVILVGIGTIMIIRAVSKRQVHTGEGPDYIDDVSIFGGGDRLVSSQNFKGGKLTAIFGGSKYNMTNAQLAKGRNVIDIFTVFGGYKFIVPQDWEVKIEVSAIFGGFSDKRSFRKDIPKDPSKELVIKGIAIFGGGDVVSF